MHAVAGADSHVVGAPTFLEAAAVMLARVGSFLVPAYVWFTGTWFPDWAGPTSNQTLRILGSSAWLFGAVISLWPVWYLRRSFAIEPAARELVTDGPYRLARHPIYAACLFMYGGSLLLHPSVPFAIVCAVWLAFQLTRIRYEEQALSTVFPEYAAYCERLGAFGPKFWRGAGARPAVPVADGASR